MEMTILERACQGENERNVIVRGAGRAADARFARWEKQRVRRDTAGQRSIIMDVELEKMEQWIANEWNSTIDI